MMMIDKYFLPKLETITLTLKPHYFIVMD